ncbi:hypothetical protein GA0061096_2317 [Fictibacillus enclensis]|nr:hypothetical protein GA0061096_2317 [Fictibacillus enclensis]
MIEESHFGSKRVDPLIQKRTVPHTELSFFLISRHQTMCPIFAETALSMMEIQSPFVF